ncbi:hypothetical protein QR680_005553 [Steinernema hermaphroditum]|uniref:phosphoenolpyruvate carboxykinase (GTP) n=1 Tax=Steinernema hermaphroditum TaxID=289476 RepID=A0AA39HSG2_9BILA|nr:hypothetical protein QR680_005553 [Steinernema hermaphroditum]
MGSERGAALELIQPTNPLLTGPLSTMGDHTTATKLLVKRFHSLTPPEMTVAGQRTPSLSQLSMVNNASTTSINDSQRTTDLSCSRQQETPDRTQLNSAVSKKEKTSESKPNMTRSNTLKKCLSKSKCLRCLKSRDFTCRTDIFVKGYGAIAVVKGDPKILPPKALMFIAEKAAILRPRSIYICDGSYHEREELIEKLQHRGVMQRLSNYTDVFVTQTDPRDVARVEHRTFVVTEEQSKTEVRFEQGVRSEVARWMAPNQYSVELDERFPGAMRGRTMFVIPFSMGSIGDWRSLNCVQLTDSPYVVVNTHKTARVSSSVWDAMGTDDFIKCVHSVGVPRPVTEATRRNWSCNPERLIVLQDQMRKEKSVALRLASNIGRNEGWLAEHMAVLSVTDPKGNEFFVAAAFPSGCGKTNLALMKPAVDGWKVKVVGDDITWIRFGEDGRMYASNPENGMFGVAAESNEKTNPLVLQMCSKNAFLANVATTSKGKFFWQGLEEQLAADEGITDWNGNPWKKGCKTQPAHPNSRFTVSMNQCPTAHEHWDSPKGVPLSAIIFGARRPKGFPLVFECFSWRHGVFTGASIRTEPSAASVSDTRTVGDQLVADPMAMRAFMGYNFADYLKHWLSLEKPGRKMPKIFGVNWFRTSEKGDLLWPGFGENIRILEWIQKRCDADAPANLVESPIGLLPTKTDVNLEGLKVDWEQLMSVPKPFWKEYSAAVKDYFARQLNKEMPEEIRTELENQLNKVKTMQ